MRKSKHFFTSLMLILAIILTGWNEQAQSQEAYPTKPIEIICPFAPGGSYDLFSRTTASFLSKKWSIPVNVVNKPGGNAIPGVLAGYNANPDGYTMFADGNSTSSLLEVAVKELPFKIMDRTYVGMVGTIPQVFIVPTKSPFKNLLEVAAEAKRDPENFTWAMHGAGTDTTGFSFRQFFTAIGVDIQKTRGIVVAGGGPGVILVAGGNAKLGCPTVGSAKSSINAGTLRALAVTQKDRHFDLPDVPTTAEAGLPGVITVQWNGISGPPKLPAFIVAKWEKALDEILKDPEMISKLRNFGMTGVYMNSKEVREYVTKEIGVAAKLWGLIK